MKKENYPRVNSICKLKEENLEHYSYAFLESDRLIYLGEIVNMPGHGIFVMMFSKDKSKNGKMYTGWHINNFTECTEDEV